MKNKKLLYGLLGVGAIAGLYFWNKNKKSTTESLAVSKEPTDESYSSANGSRKPKPKPKPKYKTKKLIRSALFGGR
jgi:hypothetical protein